MNPVQKSILIAIITFAATQESTPDVGEIAYSTGFCEDEIRVALDIFQRDGWITTSNHSLGWRQAYAVSAKALDWYESNEKKATKKLVSNAIYGGRVSIQGKKILEVFMKFGIISKKLIAEQSGVSLPGISKHLDWLIEKGIVFEHPSIGHREYGLSNEGKRLAESLGKQLKAAFPADVPKPEILYRDADSVFFTIPEGISEEARKIIIDEVSGGIIELRDKGIVDMEVENDVTFFRLKDYGEIETFDDKSLYPHHSTEGLTDDQAKVFNCLFAESPDAMLCSTIADEIGIPHLQVKGILGALRHKGYVENTTEGTSEAYRWKAPTETDIFVARLAKIEKLEARLEEIKKLAHGKPWETPEQAVESMAKEVTKLYGTIVKLATKEKE